MFKLHAAIGALMLAPTLAIAAEEFNAPLQALADSELKTIAEMPSLIAAVEAQNAQTAGLSQDEIIALDNQWRDQVGTDGPFVTEVLARPMSQEISDVVEAAQGLYTEIFITDSRGLNVAQSAKTSDYWQGDEVKFTEVFGPNVVFFGELDFDESTQLYQIVANHPIRDPETGEAIGVLHVGVNAELLLQR